MDSKPIVPEYESIGLFRQYLATTIVNIGCFACGLVSAWVSPVIPVLESKQSPIGGIPFSAEMISWTGSLPSLGAMVMSPFWGQIADKLGRKKTSFLTGVPWIVSWVVMNYTSSPWVFLVMRFISGFGNSGAMFNSSMYVSEICHKHLKGTLGSFTIFFANGGVLYAYIVGSVTEFRTFNYLCTVLVVIYIIGFLWLPESPAYLLKIKDEVGARQALVWYRGKNIDEATINAEFEILQESFLNVKKKISVKELFNVRSTIQGILIGLVLQSGIQLSGNSVIIAYSICLLRKAGVHSFSPHLSGIIIAALQVIASFFALGVVHHYGRKSILLITYAMASISLFLVGLVYYLIDINVSFPTMQYFPVISLSVYIIAVSIGVGPIPYVIYGEIFPAEVRNTSVSIIIMWNQITKFASLKLFHMMIAYIHIYGCFWFYSTFCLFVIAYLSIYLPETKGHNLKCILGKMNFDLLHRPSGQGPTLGANGIEINIMGQGPNGIDNSAFNGGQAKPDFDDDSDDNIV
ncbi:hypothetical protein M8J75_001685 [Diaphorina citri]|nr:hypothetical protein M8J75_001685 [Diaphorina citri]